MIKSSKEIILGAKQDPIFGPLVMFGLGGIYVQVLRRGFQNDTHW